ncbi:MAG: heme b synthase [Methanosarcinales archaeon]|nr:heme b synthase [Methanosarcinales archaeon]
MTRPPRLVAWELTRACNLACRHCRADAIPEPSPDELTTTEAKDFIDQLAEFGKPILIMTGGEPLLRDDFYEIAQYGTDKGLRVVLATNGTFMTPQIASRLKDVGIQRISVSIDGSDAKTHDDFRCEQGSFDAALVGIQHIKDAGIGFQINTTITKRNIEQIPLILDLAIELDAEALHIFMLVPTGRGKEIEEDEIPPEEYERVLNWFYDQREKVPLQLKATCAPHYFRIMRQRAKEEGIKITMETHGFEAMTKGCLGGSGFCFVSHIGEVYPCGFLPALAGDIRKQRFKDVWGQSKVFNDIRDVNKLKGKCGICEYRRVCSGCRARAYAATGDYMAEEPYCVYVPAGGKAV